MKNAKEIATRLDVEIRDGWYNVGDLVSVDGSPWVNEIDFLAIIDMLLDESDSVEILEAIIGAPTGAEFVDMFDMFDDE